MATNHLLSSDPKLLLLCIHFLQFFIFCPPIVVFPVLLLMTSENIYWRNLIKKITDTTARYLLPSACIFNIFVVTNILAVVVVQHRNEPDRNRFQMVLHLTCSATVGSSNPLPYSVLEINSYHQILFSFQRRIIV